ncbi:zinc-binding protein A33-like [Epinephelus lanceolatus]|uniref:zinc-binding protein A33-like n=1 Tax=Epinephelus lanceolatus TaxID=310571 RepID=UPI001448094D|nr:zinc-binding protein A33-like [Epinephelus lanceolatus]
MSCQSFLPVSLHQAEAEGLASTPWSVDSSERCEEHDESLSVFCLDDLEPLCQLCAALSHAGHRVYLLTEAVTDCKAELRTSLNGLKRKKTDFEKVAQTCEHAFGHNEAEAKLAEELMKKEFESLHQFLRDEEAAKLLALREERDEKRRNAEEQVDSIIQVIQSLEEKIQLVEEELDAEGDGVGFLEHYEDVMNSTWIDDMEPLEVYKPLIDVAKHVGNLKYAEWEKMKHIAPYTPVTLDPRTAGQSLRVSSGLNSVHISPGPSQGLEQSLDVNVPVPANPERFHPCSCILAREDFDSGVHCWDIEVGDTNNWTVGVAAQSVSRKAEFEACPEAGLWCISLQEGEYRALASPAQTLYSDHLSRVRVKLDWDEGMLEFINPDTDTHLFMFRHRFIEKVYPYFQSISLSGGFALLAQRVKVNVGSDYVPVEDTAFSEEHQVMKGESCTEGNNNTTSANSNRKMSESRHLMEDKNLPICSLRQEKKTKPQRRTLKEQLIKTKPAGNEKIKDDKPVIHQSSKPRFLMRYEVSLSRARHQK